jgi:hypothetical protein
MDGFPVIKEKAGLTVRRVNLAADRRARKERVTLLVVQQCQCVIVENGLRRAQNEFPGRKNN